MEINTPTKILELRNVHVALQQHPEDITQRFSKLSKLIRVIAYCRRVINNCRHSKCQEETNYSIHTSNWPGSDLLYEDGTTNSYAQEMKELMEQQGVAATSSQNYASKQLHEGYAMLQSSSLMAGVQDLLATEGRDWRFIPLR